MKERDIHKLIEEVNSFNSEEDLWRADTTDASGLLGMRAATSDVDRINSIGVTDDEWINSMEQIGPGVGKHMKAESLPQLSLP